MKYELLSDLPGVKAGTVSQNSEGSEIHSFFGSGIEHHFKIYEIEKYPDWFKKVEWKPDAGECFYGFNAYGDIRPFLNIDFINSDLHKMIDFGNCFPTKEAAEKALAEIKEVLKRNRGNQ